MPCGPLLRLCLHLLPIRKPLRRLLSRLPDWLFQNTCPKPEPQISRRCTNRSAFSAARAKCFPDSENNPNHLKNRMPEFLYACFLPLSLSLINREIISRLILSCFMICINTSLANELAPKRNHLLLSQSLPNVSFTITRLCSASFELEMPPAGFIPTFTPVAR